MDSNYSKKTTIQLWTDPYISAKMLEAHLDPYTNAASRKLDTIKKTCNFIESFLPKNKTICDFGCGPGLYTDILNQKGYIVTGIDVSQNSLNYAKSQNKYVTYKKMNYIERELENKVDFIQMIYCDFGAMSPYEQSHTLSNISKSLNKDGLFFFDVMNEEFFNQTKMKQHTYEETDGFFIEGHATIFEEVVKYDKQRLIMTHIMVKGTKDLEFFNYDKCYNVLEIKNLLEENGFEIMEVFADTTGSKAFNTQTLAFLCKVNHETR